jgi:hypothetical protein
VLHLLINRPLHHVIPGDYDSFEKAARDCEYRSGLDNRRCSVQFELSEGNPNWWCAMDTCPRVYPMEIKEVVSV